MLTRKREKKNVFVFFVFVFFIVVFKKNARRTEDHVEEVQTGLGDLRYFLTQKQDCGALLYLHVFLFPNTWLRGVTPLDAHTLTHAHTRTRDYLSNPCLVILPPVKSASV